TIDTYLILQGKRFVSLRTVVERQVRQQVQQWKRSVAVSKIIRKCLRPVTKKNPKKFVAMKKVLMDNEKEG
ncbi:unnamed protein product, partial [Timema podura]|nr:unnamed protein product [Timema podura]